jgi:hypothetical protein
LQKVGSVALCLFPDADAMNSACSEFQQWLVSHGDPEGSAFHLFDVIFLDQDNRDNILAYEVNQWFEDQAPFADDEGSGSEDDYDSDMETGERSSSSWT